MNLPQRNEEVTGKKGCVKMGSRDKKGSCRSQKRTTAKSMTVSRIPAFTVEEKGERGKKANNPMGKNSRKRRPSRNL